MEVNSFETTLLNLAPLGAVLYVVIGPKEALNRKMISIDIKAREKLSKESRDNLLSCSRCRDIQG